MVDMTTSQSASAPFSGPESASWGSAPAPSFPMGCTVDQAFRYCADLTSAHYENFPVASLFLPGEKRPYIQAIYAFSRIADDFADEPGLLPADRLARLDDWGSMLAECYQGRAEHPVFIALRETVERNRIPQQPLNDLLAAFKRDVTQRRYETFDDLLSYCRLSANPVGRLLLMLFGYHDEALFARSDKICTALQLTNFWQDLFADLERDRLYVPLEDMRRFGYTVEQWSQKLAGPECGNLMKFQVERTREMFYEGAELPSLVGTELQIELRMVWFGGMSVLKMLARRGPDPFRRRVLGATGKFMVLLRALAVRDLSRWGRKKKPWDLT